MPALTVSVKKQIKGGVPVETLYLVLLTITYSSLMVLLGMGIYVLLWLNRVG